MIGLSAAAPDAQFNQQASDTLKAFIGIGTSITSNTSHQAPTLQQQIPHAQDPNSSALFSHPALAQASSAFTSIKSHGQAKQPLHSTGDFFEEWNKITHQIHIKKFEELTADYVLLSVISEIHKVCLCTRGPSGYQK